MFTCLYAPYLGCTVVAVCNVHTGVYGKHARPGESLYASYKSFSKYCQWQVRGMGLTRTCPLWSAVLCCGVVCGAEVLFAFCVRVVS